ncbi:chromate transporter [Paenibacillus pectinilyticus]|uniref:Chromate transporter n=1 Tax=Paenibacillus pectinilyticus TaxID=512399 RepID=A0A1C0ZWC4_9BACL|nr:chromate transporter [Paenibacillus pectinilyticus]OCT12338.1 chromate transporter [Paenibacillus pectinilyticus]
MLISLFLTFLKIGLVSFGGGYAMIPVIQRQVEKPQWLTSDEFNHVISLAGTSPGPIATNCATLIGYESAGIPGAIMATLGMVLPSLILIITLAAFLFRWHSKTWFQSSFYGLKPVVTGFIIYAALHFGLSSFENVQRGITWRQVATLLITIGAFLGIVKYKLHPFLIIVFAGMVGIVFFL